MDSKIERMERRIFRLRDRKTILDSDDALNLLGYYQAIVEALRELERSLTDFNTVVSD